MSVVLIAQSCGNGQLQGSFLWLVDRERVDKKLVALSCQEPGQPRGRPASVNLPERPASNGYVTDDGLATPMRNNLIEYGYADAYLAEYKVLMNHIII